MTSVTASPRPSALRADGATRERAAWWLWPHLLSLDAPLVAITWQRWWAREAGISLRPAEEIILALGVWMIYLADRLADVSRAGPGHHETARHAFYAARRRVMWPLAIVALVSLTLLAPVALPAGQFLGGLALLASVAGYYWLIHCLAWQRWGAILPKEAVVGALFATGSAFFVVGARAYPGTAQLTGPAFFGGLCFLNCALITKWERTARDLREPTSLLNAYPGVTARLRVACVALAGIALAIAAMTGRAMLLPVAASALLLALLDSRRSAFSADVLRMLADMVLLTPALWLLS